MRQSCFFAVHLRPSCGVEHAGTLGQGRQKRLSLALGMAFTGSLEIDLDGLSGLRGLPDTEWLLPGAVASRRVDVKFPFGTEGSKNQH